MEKFDVTVVISFYNNFRFLELVLAGFERQSFKNFEILIADDGSNEEIINKLKSYISTTPLHIRHIWHEDLGWRKNMILNKAIMESNSDYLIFVDGDCVPHKNFVSEHYMNKEMNTILAGRRSNLSKYVSEQLTYNNVKNGSLERKFAIIGFLFKSFIGGSHLENAIYFSNKNIRKRLNKKDKGVLGSNFSLFKKDILDVNGFDERYLKPAVGEDTDLEYRLRNAGKKVKTVKHLAIQYHLFHKKLERDKANMEYLNQVIENKTTFTPYGINK